MLGMVMSAAVILLPSVVSVLLDSRLAKETKNLVSKYCFYFLVNNFIMLSFVFLRGMSRQSVLTAFTASKTVVITSVVSLIAAAVWPVIIRKRLPKVFETAFNFLMRKKVYSLLVVLTLTAFFVIRAFCGKNVTVLSAFASFFGVALAVIIPAILLFAFKLVKASKENNIKKTLENIKTSLKDKDFCEFKKRFSFAALVNFAFAFSIALFIPFETYLGNAREFVFNFSEFWWIVALEALVYFVLLFFLEFAFGNRAFNTVVALVFGLILASYVQSMFLNGIMSQMDGSGDSRSLVSVVVNLVIWAVIAIAPAVITALGLKFWKTVCCFGSVIIVGMQLVALVSLIGTVDKPRVEERISQKGLYEVAEKDNVIVFVLDCFDQDNVDEMLKREPHVLDGLKGFRRYDNVTGSYCYTHLAVPYLISGERIPEYDPTDEQFLNAINTSRYYNTITKNVSSVGVYTDEFCLRGYEARSKIDNICSSENATLNIDLTVLASQKASVYRVAPFLFKKYFNYTSETFNSAVLSSAEGDEFYLVSARTDAAIKDRFERDGLKINKDYKDGCFRFIHTNGAHSLWNLDKNGNYSADQTDRISASLGSIKIVSSYLKALNDAGVYEDATIIITSDHGTTDSYREEDNPDVSVNPILFYKPKGVGYEGGCQISSAPVSHDDIFPTVMNAFGFEYKNENGMLLDEITEETNRTRYYYWCYREPDMPEAIGNFMHVEYAITGNSKDSANWQKTGNVVHSNGWKQENGQ